MAADIPNGTLCYTGLTPNSTATFSCDKGYELNGNSSAVLECLPNGAWNETFPNCTKSKHAPNSMCCTLCAYTSLVKAACTNVLDT